MAKAAQCFVDAFINCFILSDNIVEFQTFPKTCLKLRLNNFIENYREMGLVHVSSICASNAMIMEDFHHLEVVK